MRGWIGTATIILTAAMVQADSFDQPSQLTLTPDVASVYAPPSPNSETEGVNSGGVHIDLEVRYMTDYIFRGMEILEVPGSEDSPNLQLAGKLSWDLGKLPHPFIGLFANVADHDPLSQFQEIRPTVGFDWDIRPLTITAGHNSYIYPDRKEMDTSEIFVKMKLDDAWLWSTERPLLSPYVMAAYDYDLYNGWYFEAGVEHTLTLEDLGIDLTFYGQVAYVYNNPLYAYSASKDDGFQHWQTGVIGRYSLNKLFNTSVRYGRWELVGYLNYTGSGDDRLRAEDQLWGGAAIGFHY
ncbi:MAG: hypothetical protein IT448_02955 [Phycisphaerales bacterium]|nr:hypothetical protein [Phycisphaerales bacterium]